MKIGRFRKFITLTPRKFAGIYIGISVLWIVISDTIAANMASSSVELARIQTIKGWVFVVISGGIIFGLITFYDRQQQETLAGYETLHEHMNVVHRVLRHNIRNELNVVQGYINLARDETTDESIQPHLKRASLSVSQFTEMADKLRVIDDIDPINPANNPLDLVPFVEEKVQKLESIYPNATIRTELPERAIVKGDSALGIVIEELVENGIKHAQPQPDEPEVAITVTESPGVVSLEVSDNGPGIPEHEIQVLSQRFETTLTHSSGVGLWMIQWIVRLLNGDITIEDDTASGTTVTVEFEQFSRLDYPPKFLANDALVSTD